jgi:isoleucyl-tRNA synthetase
LTSVGSRGRAPFNAVLTHGFTVDEAGKKMSKSLGNVVDPQDVRDKHGADVLRFWVASADFRADMSASENILKQVEEAFGKVRNTCRFLLSNLNDFDIEKDRVAYSDLMEIDRWALLRLSRLTEKINKAYENFEFHVVFHAVRDFCIIDLSALYLDIIKDRLYCDGGGSKERRGAQTVHFEMLETLILLLAPILSFTGEDLWKHFRKIINAKDADSVFYIDFPKVVKEYLNAGLEQKWEKILTVREAAYKALEEARAEKRIGSSLEAKVLITVPGETKEILDPILADLPSIFICSEVHIKEGEESYSVSKATGAKCERCWNFRETVGKNKKHPTLCARCEKVVEGGK